MTKVDNADSGSITTEKPKCILVIDDKEDELQRASEAVQAKGWKPITVSPINDNDANWCHEWIMSRADGVLTDLMWDFFGQGEKPQGLLVVIRAMYFGKPVVVCTNANDYSGGHHGEAMGFIRDGFICQVGQDAFGFVENKNWKEAVEKLEQKFADKAS